MSEDFRDYRPDRKTTGFIASWVMWVIGVSIVLSIVFGVIGFFGGWFSQPARIYGVENVREQWQFAYDYNNSLKAAQRQFCTADHAVHDSSDAEERDQRVSQRIAMENNYSRIEAAYNARLQNAFQAKLVRPADVPAQAPELDRSCN